MNGLEDMRALIMLGALRLHELALSLGDIVRIAALGTALLAVPPPLGLLRVASNTAAARELAARACGGARLVAGSFRGEN